MKTKDNLDVKKSFKVIEGLYSFPNKTKFVNIDYYLSLVLER